jgi:uncharacterized caspase-like protein
MRATRRRARWVAVLVAIAASNAGPASPVRAQTPPRKYALLIGLNEYLNVATVPYLTYAEKDVRDLETALKAQGYKVTVVLNSDAVRSRLVSELYKYATLVNEGDEFLLYFAGHGVRNRYPSRRTYWLTYDADLDFLDVSGIRLQHLLDFLSDVPARRKLILLDHCFSGDVVTSPATPAPTPSPDAATAVVTGPAPAAGSGGSRGPTGASQLARNAFPVGEIRNQVTTTAEGTVTIVSSRNEAFELPAPIEHGVFTAALLRALKNESDADANGDRKLSIDELKAFLPREMRKLAPIDQDPLESTQATNTHLWFVADALPLSPAADTTEKRRDADQKKRAYTDKLSNWEQRGWISAQSKQRCWQAVLDWVESVRDPARLLPDDKQRLIDRIRRAMEGDPGFEQARADELNTYVESLP